MAVYRLVAVRALAEAGRAASGGPVDELLALAGERVLAFAARLSVGGPLKRYVESLWSGPGPGARLAEYLDLLSWMAWSAVRDGMDSSVVGERLRQLYEESPVPVSPSWLPDDAVWLACHGCDAISEEESLLGFTAAVAEAGEAFWHDVVASLLDLVVATEAARRLVEAVEPLGGSLRLAIGDGGGEVEAPPTLALALAHTGVLGERRGEVEVWAWRRLAGLLESQTPGVTGVEEAGGGVRLEVETPWGSRRWVAVRGPRVRTYEFILEGERSAMHVPLYAVERALPVLAYLHATLEEAAARGARIATWWPTLDSAHGYSIAIMGPREAPMRVTAPIFHPTLDAAMEMLLEALQALGAPSP